MYMFIFEQSFQEELKLVLHFRLVKSQNPIGLIQSSGNVHLTLSINKQIQRTLNRIGEYKT